MSNEMGRRISSAIAVRWTPALAARVERRIEHRLARRRRQRHAALVALALLGVAGVGFAFSHPWTRLDAGAKPGQKSAQKSGQTSAQTSGQACAQPAPTSLPPLVAPPTSPALAPLPAPEAPPAKLSPFRAPPAHHLASAARHAAPEKTVAALFAAADAARLAGRPADAVAPLTAIFTLHPNDPRAAVAAYQLGRVRAFDLHDRDGAAAAFARAHDLDPNGPLAADAAAHAAETRSAEEKAK
jgi:TolA-binding protein